MLIWAVPAHKCHRIHDKNCITSIGPCKSLEAPIVARPIQKCVRSGQSWPCQVLHRVTLKLKGNRYFDISNLVVSMLFAYATCVSCSERQDVETADIRYEVTQQQPSDRFYHRQHSDTSFLIAQVQAFPAKIWDSRG
jgi:hypothetical protein